LDDWIYQDLQVARFFRVRPGDPGEWYNDEFYDRFEFMLVQDEIDRRRLAKNDGR
jgi:hypothetical protein